MLHNAEGCLGSSGMVRAPRQVREGIFCGCYRAWEVAWRQGEGRMEMAEGVTAVVVLTSGGVAG